MQVLEFAVWGRILLQPRESIFSSAIFTWIIYRDLAFLVLFNPLTKVHVWGPASSVHTLEARLARYLSPPLFPVHLRDLANVVCHEVPCPPFDIGPFRIRTSLICHPGPTVGYRIESEDGIVAYLCDHEPALGMPNGRMAFFGLDFRL